MSKWDADQPGTGTAWWAARAGVVPLAAHASFQRFLTALGAHNGGGGSVHEVSVAVTELIEALPNKSVPAPTRERLARLLGTGKVSSLLHPSGYAPASASQNLILGLTNLLALLGGSIVPAAYRGI